MALVTKAASMLLRPLAGDVPVAVRAAARLRILATFASRLEAQRPARVATLAQSGALDQLLMAFHRLARSRPAGVLIGAARSPERFRIDAGGPQVRRRVRPLGQVGTSLPDPPLDVRVADVARFGAGHRLRPGVLGRGAKGEELLLDRGAFLPRRVEVATFRTAAAVFLAELGIEARQP